MSSTQIVGRMYFVHPSDFERFALRMLLLYRKGCTSFKSIRTVDGVLYDSYRNACKALGFFDNDSESELCLFEAANFASASQMRDLFVLILLNCAPNNPGELWQKFKNHMSDDILHQKRNLDPCVEFDNEIFNIALNKINESLLKIGKHISNYFNMPEIWQPQCDEAYLANNLINEQLQYDLNKLKNEIEENVPKLNNEQRIIYDRIIRRTFQQNLCGGNTFFIDGPGGCGKTFVYKVILATVRLQRKIALAVASSGIAAQLLDGGRTGHSRFKVPFILNSTSTCNLPLQSEHAILISKASLILWDECPMMHRHAFEALDQSLRDIMGSIDPRNRKIPFGNKVIVFGGDFRQILPVVKKGTRNDIINASFNRSKIWKKIIKLKLTINMRVCRLTGTDQVKAQEFIDFLLRIGN